MLSFRVGEQEAVDAQRTAQRLGISLSDLLRQALHRHLVRMRAEDDVAAWVAEPLTAEEQSLEAIADWGPAEDWSDWADAAG